MVLRGHWILRSIVIRDRVLIEAGLHMTTQKMLRLIALFLGLLISVVALARTPISTILGAYSTGFLWAGVLHPAAALPLTLLLRGQTACPDGEEISKL
jgi:hypothetical protein